MIGAYAFATSDWKELDYPLDLWIKWNSKHFDQLALATYGEMEMDVPDNVTVQCFSSSPSDQNFDFYLKGKSYAQKMLRTDWKVALDIDEFVAKRIDVVGLDKRKAYAFRMRHLYGNALTEIIDAFPDHYFRCHFGGRRILGDGGSVSPPYAATFSIRKAIVDIAAKAFGIGSYASPYAPLPGKDYEVWHTGALRRPEVMSIKWRTQIEREVKNRIIDNSSRLPYLSNAFDYHEFKHLSSEAKLKKVSTDELPRVLLENLQRFDYANFDQNEYASFVT